MRRTRPAPILLLAAIGVIGGWGLDAGLAASGRPVVVPPFTLPVALVAIGAIVVALAIPVRRAVRAKEHGRVDPFFATRVLVLAKASSLSGSLLAGAGGGILLYLISRSVVPGVGSVVMAIATVVGAVLLLIAGLVAERMCEIPPEDEDGAGPSPSAATHQG